MKLSTITSNKRHESRMLEHLDTGKLFYVTWDDGRVMRVTPLDEHPLSSIEIAHSDTNFRELSSEEVVFHIEQIAMEVTNNN